MRGANAVFMPRVSVPPVGPIPFVIVPGSAENDLRA